MSFLTPGYRKARHQRTFRRKHCFSCQSWPTGGMYFTFYHKKFNNHITREKYLQSTAHENILYYPEDKMNNKCKIHAKHKISRRSGNVAVISQLGEQQ